MPRKAKEVRVAIVGDPHFNYKAPSSRIDDYESTVFEKFDFIRRTCAELGIKQVFLLGDVFHSPRQPLFFVNKVLNLFVQYKESGLDVFSIVGNHDIISEKMESIPKTPLQTLFVAGVVNSLGEGRVVEDGDVCIHGFDYPEVIEKNENKDKYNVCMAHRYYELELSDFSLYKDNLDFLNYDCYIFGHDHEPYDIKREGKWSLIRPGTPVRGTAAKYNKERQPSFSIVTFKDGTVEEERVPIPCSPGNLVFSERVFAPKKKQEESADIFRSVVKKMQTHTQRKDDVYSYLDSMTLETETKKMIEMYLSEAGFIRN